jgi:hypothetical protein
MVGRWLSADLPPFSLAVKRWPQRVRFDAAELHPLRLTAFFVMVVLGVRICVAFFILQESISDRKRFVEVKRM